MLLTGPVRAAMAGALFLAGAAAASAESLVDPADYAEVLATHVKDGAVDYAALKKDRGPLDRYLERIAALPPGAFEGATEAQQVAYLVNAYNAYTLQSIVNHHPIKARGGFLNAIRGTPSDSIKQIPGVWDRTKHATAIGKVTLDDIEHRNLRVRYDMPLVHMGLVCASKGCPPLRGEPFDPERLTEQLEEQARIYLASKHGLRVEGGGSVKVSMIFKWFADDFDSHGGAKAFVARYAPAGKAAAVKKAARLGYLDYDWSLNDVD